MLLRERDLPLKEGALVRMCHQVSIFGTAEHVPAAHPAATHDLDYGPGRPCRLHTNRQSSTPWPPRES